MFVQNVKIKLVMILSFEKQFCEKCGRLCFCVDSESLDLPEKYSHKPKQKWLCSECYGWVLENAQTKDTIRSIMIQCGIEDLDLQRN